MDTKKAMYSEMEMAVIISTKAEEIDPTLWM
jgi:hypothetical protein